VRWFGAILIIAGFGLFGFSLAANHRREETALRQLIGALDYMQCELQYHMTPLPDLCRQAGEQNRNVIGQVLLMLARELDDQISADVEQCMETALKAELMLPDKSKMAFDILGSTLGRFDMEGQIRGLEGVRSFCRRELEALGENRDARLRCFQTLGLCAGSALAILLV
jgi:stage III sporulation protein AB